jgi:hypothetical protein
MRAPYFFLVQFRAEPRTTLSGRRKNAAGLARLVRLRLDLEIALGGVSP